MPIKPNGLVDSLILNAPTNLSKNSYLI